jgi:hypothetical protein
MGTSFSAPHVTGTIALMYELDDTLSYQTVKDILIQSSNNGFLDTYAALTNLIDCMPGDADGGGSVDMLDITYLIDYLYKGGSAPTPYPICSGDANCTNCSVNVLDITRLINYLYSGGIPPCTQDEWISSCGLPLRK